MSHPHRTPPMKAKYAADRYARTPEDLEALLEQFHPAHRASIIERLRPHLTFEPEILVSTKNLSDA